MNSDASRDELDDVFTSLGESEEAVESLVSGEDDDWDEEYGDDSMDVASSPLQFPLTALFVALLLTGLFSLAYLYQRAFGFLLFFAVATTVAARTKRKRERVIATLFFGGAAAICGGLMMAESSRPPVALAGLVVACLGGYASLHSVALVIASFWE